MNRLRETPVSIAMATYNGAAYLEEQIRSVQAEMLPQDEVVIVDDGSADETPALLADLLFPQMHVYRNPKNVGLQASFERALKLTRHDLVFLCDQDDVWLPGKRGAFVEAFLEDSRCMVVVSDAEVVDGSGAQIAPSFMRGRGGFKRGLWSTLYKNRYLGCCMALRREVIDAGVPIPNSVPRHDMWFGLLGNSMGTVRYLPTPYTQYRRHGTNVSPSRPASLPTMLRWRASLLIATRLRLWRPRNAMYG